ncbi:hypothetical protein CRG98_011623 [Punica granatum]|uniref:Reverse transcriptase zinc-binding domain-containing protein n=1 Tax=Punica granatum TaxID=22663 RepID=A0A2I0KHL6_PUNGR|nr:hypothetical protein CRG98_011623 [Punica granatum]
MVIMDCVTTTTMQVLWNGEATEEFIPKRGVPILVHDRFCSLSTFIQMDNLGKYLGIPIVHGRVQKSLFQGVVDRVRSRLSGWSASALSMAGRTTLVQSILQAVPMYTMQESMTLPKDRGGLGLRRMREFNQALLGKVRWKFVTRPTDLWACVLSHKYPNRVNLDNSLVAKPTDSWLWRGICISWNSVRHGMAWQLRGGQRTRFWLDTWVPGSGPLIDKVATGSNPSQLQVMFMTLSWSREVGIGIV